MEYFDALYYHPFQPNKFKISTNYILNAIKSYNISKITRYRNIIYSLNRLQSSKASIIEKRHQKKYDNLVIEKRL